MIQRLIQTSLLSAILLIGTTSACAEESSLSVTSNTAQVAIIEGVIMNNLDDVTAALLNADTAEDFDLIINSPGGGVVAGFRFLNILDHVRANGLHVRCFVPGMAASMAFQIFLHCDERYALSKSFLLWHRARISGAEGPLTAPQLEVMSRSLQSMDDVILREVEEQLSSEMSREEIRWHFETETFHIASELHRRTPNFVAVQADIPNLLETLQRKDVARTRQDPLSMFGIRRGELIYMSPTAAKQFGVEEY